MPGVMVGPRCGFCGCVVWDIGHVQALTGEVLLTCRACDCPHEDRQP
jgi:hypothetical protein